MNSLKSALASLSASPDLERDITFAGDRVFERCLVMLSQTMQAVNLRRWDEDSAAVAAILICSDFYIDPKFGLVAGDPDTDDVVDFVRSDPDESQLVITLKAGHCRYYERDKDNEEPEAKMKISLVNGEKLLSGNPDLYPAMMDAPRLFTNNRISHSAPEWLSLSFLPCQSS